MHVRISQYGGPLVDFYFCEKGTTLKEKYNVKCVQMYALEEIVYIYNILHKSHKHTRIITRMLL